MILECPSCGTRYLVQIGLFAQGGRKVRCAKCKNEWHVKLPSSVDVVVSSPDYTPVSDTVPEPPSSTYSSRPPPLNVPTPNLPAVIEKGMSPKETWILLGFVFFAALLTIGSIWGRQSIVKTLPELRGSYSAVGLSVLPEWEGLIFDEVKSELKYDSGTMRLFVDGVVRNASEEIKKVPDIKAQALGADKSVIQSWLIDAPAATIDSWGMVPFHSDVATPMERTIEDVYLEFTPRKENGNADE
jgi:predicted Zn finger-like uncharacterized protein